MASAERVRIRSYRGVVDSVERRIFHLDRWRLPNPEGISVRALLYTLGAAFAILVISRLPILSMLLGLFPASVRYVALPIICGRGLASWQIDGRAPHHALAGAVRHLVAPKALAGLRPCPEAGELLTPVSAIQVSPSGDDSVYRSGRVRGPARITLRYPASITPEGGEGLEDAKRLRISQTPGGRPMPIGHELSVPAGLEVVFDG